MLFGTHRQTSAPIGGIMPLWSILASAGLQGNASFCLDAGDAASYAGTGQSWLDRSAGGFDFFRGATNGSEGSDPTFVGTAGDLTQNTYFQFDGGDWFDYDSASEPHQRAWHAAGAAFTFITLLYVPPAFSWPVISTAILATGWANGPGVIWGLTASNGRPFLNVYSTATTTTYYAPTDNGLAAGWHMVALSVAAGVANGSFHFVDGAFNPVSTVNQPTINYSSPGSNASIGQVPRIGNCDSGATASGCLGNGVRMAGFAALNRAATKAELDAVWALARQRFGI